MKTLVHAFITSRVDYGNAVLAASPKSTTDTLQRVLNAAARLVSNTDKYDRRLSSLLHDQLHWLNVSESSTSSLLWFAGVWRTKLRRIWATTAFRSPPSAADTYVQSTSISWLYVPRYRRITFGHRAFSVAGPMIWNSLTTEFRDLSVGWRFSAHC